MMTPVHLGMMDTPLTVDCLILTRLPLLFSVVFVEEDLQINLVTHKHVLVNNMILVLGQC